MAQESLLGPLRRAIEAARRRGVTVREKAIYTHAGDVRGEVILEVTPTSAGGVSYAISSFFSRLVLTARGGGPVSESLPTDEANERIRQLEQELTDMRQYLRNLSEDHEAHSEELRARE